MIVSQFFLFTILCASQFYVDIWNGCHMQTFCGVSLSFCTEFIPSDYYLIFNTDHEFYGRFGRRLCPQYPEFEFEIVSLAFPTPQYV